MWYKLYKFFENRARDTPLCSYSTFWSNLSKNFSFWGPTPLLLHRWVEIWHGGGDQELVPSSVPNFTPIGATCGPCGAKNLKIGL